MTDKATARRAAEEAAHRAAELRTALAHCYGGDTLVRHPMFPRTLYTQGIQTLAEKGGADWLVEVVLSHQITPKVRAEDFQVWTLTVDQETGRGVVTMTDGGKDDDEELEIVRQEIPFTDFPLPSVKMYLENGVLMLPQER